MNTPESELTSNLIWGMEWTGQNFCNGETYQSASVSCGFSFAFSLSLSLALWVCMNDFSANFLLISNVTGNGVITWELWSWCSVSILVQASGVLSKQDPAVPYHCNVCLPSANMLCIQMCQNVSQSKSCTYTRENSGQASFKSISCFIYQNVVLEIIYHHAGLRRSSGRMHPSICCLSTNEEAKMKMPKCHQYSHSVADGLSLTGSIYADDL